MRNFSILTFSLAFGFALITGIFQLDRSLVWFAVGSVLLTILLTYTFPIRLTGLAGVMGLASVIMNTKEPSIPVNILLYLSLIGMVLGVVIEYFITLSKLKQGGTIEDQFPGW